MAEREAASPVRLPYIEDVPPDVTAGVFWLKKPRPAALVQQMEHVLGKYMISDKHRRGVG